MCGIAGFTQFQRSWGDKDTLVSMGEAIKHRGPDASGTYLDKHIGLCHRRLSIIDLSKAGNQPMVSHDGRYVIAFNGEIYNYLELRKELVKQGYPFKTKTDTEVILALYSGLGTGCLNKMNGMFAFALWDTSKETLFLARDRIGKKPLYYYYVDNDVVFASELKAMLKIADIPRSIRLDSVYDFFAYQYIPDPKTIFNDIYKLEPGHYLTIDKNGMKKSRYWDISFNDQSHNTEAELKKELQKYIHDCTAARMIADVPLGAFLSGGIDSSGIVATMAKISDKPVTTCSIGFDVKQFNETEFARIVAEKFETNHFELEVHENVNENLEHIASFFDEPFADPSLVPTFFVSKLAREKVTVAIAGDGGDEVFAGYQKYTTDYIENRLREKFPKWIRYHLFPELSRAFSKFNLTVFRKASSLLKSLSMDPAMAYYISNSHIKDEDWTGILLEKTRIALGNYHPSSITTRYYDQSDGNDHLSRILYTDMKTYLPGDILVKVDRMSMANSLEVRAPLLDYKMIEFAATLRPELKFEKGEKKLLLKKAFDQELPNEILYRKKMGFSPPLAQWLRHELKGKFESTVLGSKHGVIDYFSMDRIKELWLRHLSGSSDNSAMLWSLLMFQLWWDNYMTANSEQ